MTGKRVLPPVVIHPERSMARSCVPHMRRVYDCYSGCGCAHPLHSLHFSFLSEFEFISYVKIKRRIILRYAFYKPAAGQNALVGAGGIHAVCKLKDNAAELQASAKGHICPAVGVAVKTRRVRIKIIGQKAETQIKKKVNVIISGVIVYGYSGFKPEIDACGVQASQTVNMPRKLIIDSASES